MAFGGPDNNYMTSLHFKESASSSRESSPTSPPSPPPQPSQVELKKKVEENWHDARNAVDNLIELLTFLHPERVEKWNKLIGETHMKIMNSSLEKQPTMWYNHCGHMKLLLFNLQEEQCKLREKQVYEYQEQMQIQSRQKPQPISHATRKRAKVSEKTHVGKKMDGKK
jgi:hypothetical protein